MGGVNRKRSRMAIISMVLFVVFLILGRISWNSFFIITSMLFLIVWLILFLTTNRCPYCGQHFEGIYWSKPSAGYCRKCGNLIEYDDSIK